MSKRLWDLFPVDIMCVVIPHHVLIFHIMHLSVHTWVMSEL